MKVAVLDYERGDVVIIEMKDGLEGEEIEGLIAEKGYSIGDVYYMVVPKGKENFIKIL